MNLVIGNITIGSAAIDNLVLAPGNNALPLRATISLATIAANLQQIVKQQPALTTNGTLAINATGNTTTYNGQRLTYFERVLNPVVLTATVPVQQLLSGGGGGGAASTGNASTNGTASANREFAMLLARHLSAKHISAKRAPVVAGKMRSSAWGW